VIPTSVDTTRNHGRQQAQSLSVRGTAHEARVLVAATCRSAHGYDDIVSALKSKKKSRLEYWKGGGQQTVTAVTVIGELFVIIILGTLGQGEMPGYRHALVTW
jgi:hypothetical protein